MLWNASINLEQCGFFANTTGAGIEHTVSGSNDYIGLTFSGNTFDILYSAAASSGVLTINATDSNPSTSEITNATGNSVSIVNSVTLNVHVEDTDGNNIEGAQVYIQKVSKTAFTSGAGNTAGDGDLVVTQAIDSDIPQVGWVIVNDVWKEVLN